MRDEARLELDRVEALPVGAGKLDLTAYLRGNTDALHAGARVDVEHRTTSRLSLFGQGWAGMTWSSAGRAVDYGALAGLRIRF